jgi:hypothetical protein
MNSEVMTIAMAMTMTMMISVVLVDWYCSVWVEANQRMMLHRHWLLL